MTESAAYARTPQETPLGGTGFGLLLLRGFKTLAWSVLILAGLTLIFSLLSARTYTSVFTFFPQARRSASSLSGLASQFGVSIQGGEAAQSTQFYVDLVTSRAILRRIAAKSLVVGARDTQAVPAVLGIKDGNEARRQELTIRWLSSHIEASFNIRSGVITAKVTSRWPTISQQLGVAILDEVSRYNVETRQSQATAERRFTERRLADVREALRQAEDSMRDFMERNRNISGSPELVFARQRLERQLSLQQAIYTQLMTGLESAKIEEIRDTPVLTVINPPESPAQPDARGTLLRVAVAMVLGVFIGLLFTFWRDAVSRLDGPDGAPVLREMRDAALARGGLVQRVALFVFLKESRKR